MVIEFSSPPHHESTSAPPSFCCRIFRLLLANKTTTIMLARYTKLIAYIFLLLAFFYLFGYDNILRYLRGGTTVVKYDEKIDAIPPPGIKMHI